MSDETERSLWRAHELERDWPSWERWARFAGRAGAPRALDLLRACARWGSSQPRMFKIHAAGRQRTSSLRMTELSEFAEAINLTLFRRAARALRELRRLGREPVDGTAIPELMKHVYEHRAWQKDVRTRERAGASRLREADNLRMLEPHELASAMGFANDRQRREPNVFERRLREAGVPRARPVAELPPAVAAHVRFVEDHVARDRFIETEMASRFFRRDPLKPGHWTSLRVAGVEIRHRTIIRWLDGLWPDEPRSRKKISNELDVMLGLAT